MALDFPPAHALRGARRDGDEREHEPCRHRTNWLTHRATSYRASLNRRAVGVSLKRRRVSRFRMSSGSRTTVRGLHALADFRVSMSIGRSAKRGSCSSHRNGSRPRQPSPMCSWRSTRLPHGRFESFACSTRNRSNPTRRPKAFERLAVPVRRRDVVPGCHEVTGVEADARARRSIEVLEDGGEMLEAMADGPALAGGVFEQHHRPASRAGAERLANGVGDETQRVRHRPGRARAGMQRPPRGDRAHARDRARR